MPWIGIPISGIRPVEDIWTTYSTWDTVPELPDIDRFAWVPKISRDDRDKLSSIEIVKKYSKEIEIEINSPSRCYVDTAGTCEKVLEPVGVRGEFVEYTPNNKTIQPFYHDQQGCVHWAMYGTDDDHEVVTYYIDERHNPLTPYIKYKTGHTIESFLWRWYLESHAWHKYRSRSSVYGELDKSSIEFNDDDSPIDHKLKEYVKYMQKMYCFAIPK